MMAYWFRTTALAASACLLLLPVVHAQVAPSTALDIDLRAEPAANTTVQVLPFQVTLFLDGLVCLQGASFPVALNATVTPGAPAADGDADNGTQNAGAEVPGNLTARVYPETVTFDGGAQSTVLVAFQQTRDAVLQVGADTPFDGAVTVQVTADLPAGASGCTGITPGEQPAAHAEADKTFMFEAPEPEPPQQAMPGPGVFAVALMVLGAVALRRRRP